MQVHILTEQGKHVFWNEIFYCARRTAQWRRQRLHFPSILVFATRNPTIQHACKDHFYRKNYEEKLAKWKELDAIVGDLGGEGASTTRHAPTTPPP